MMSPGWLERLERSDGGDIKLKRWGASVEKSNNDISGFMSRSGRNAGSSGRMSWSGL